jgi:hypothetical protein
MMNAETVIRLFSIQHSAFIISSHARPQNWDDNKPHIRDPSWDEPVLG